MAFKRIVANSEEDLKTIMNDIMNWFKETKDYKVNFSKEKRKFLDDNKNIVEKNIDVIKAVDGANGKETSIKFVPMKEKGEMKIEIGGEGETAVAGKISNQMKGKGKLKDYSKDKKVKLGEDEKSETPNDDLRKKILSTFKHQFSKGKEGKPFSSGETLPPNTKIKKSELKEMIKEELKSLLKENFKSFDDLEFAIKQYEKGDSYYDMTKLKNIFNQLEDNDQQKARTKHSEYFGKIKK
jgi:hypothetical protein